MILGGNERALYHRKSDKIVLSKGKIPTRGMGSDGDITVGELKGQSVLFAKVNGKWFSTLLNPINHIEVDLPHYDSGWVPVERDPDGEDGRTIGYDFVHNLGSRMLSVSVYVKDDESNIFLISASQSANTSSTKESGIWLYMYTLNSINIGIANDQIFRYYNTHANGKSGTNILTGDLRVLAWKTGVVE